MNRKKLIVPAGLFLLMAFFASHAAIASADSVSATVTAPASASGGQYRGEGSMRHGPAMLPGVIGTVTAVNGSTITVSGYQGMHSSTTAATTFTVDASNAKVFNVAARSQPTTITVADIAIGDNVMVQGTVSSTSVTAKSVMDGVVAHAFGPGRVNPGGPMIPAGRAPGGKGVVGTVSTVSGDTLTVTSDVRHGSTTASTTYTVDASNATVLKAVSGSKPATSTLSAIQAGDTVLVRGTTTGSTIAARTIVDGVEEFAKNLGAHIMGWFHGGHKAI